MKSRIIVAIVALVTAIECRFLCAADPAEVTKVSTASKTISWPDTIAATRAKAFFEALAAEDEEAMRRFQQENRSPDSFKDTPLEARVVKARSVRDQLGPLEIAKVTADGNLAVDVTARSSKMGLWMKFHFKLLPDPPHYLESMSGMPTGPPDVELGVIEPWTDLADMLEKVRKRSGLPAIAAAWVQGGQLQGAAAVGVRRMDQSNTVELSDRFHVGSVGKSMTATMIAKLVETGVLRRETTVGETLKDIEMRSEYRAVTLENLLQHRGGIHPYTDDLAEDALPAVKSAGSPTRQRAAFAAQVLNETPVAQPGTVMMYSNAGYSLAAHMAERATGKSWEQLMESHVFGPLGMKNAGVGWPATPERPEQPYGHFENPPNLRVQGVSEYPLGVFLAPAGDLHCTIEDLARYASFHLQGFKGRDDWLKGQTVRWLHHPPVNERTGYAYGWMIDETSDGKPRHWHDGSAGTFFARVVLLPAADLAVVLASNAGVAAKPFLDQIGDAIVARAAEKAKTESTK